MELSFGRRRLVGVLAHDHQLLVGEAAHDVAFVPQRLDHADRCAAMPSSVGEAQVLGPHADHHLVDPGRLEVLDQLGGHRHSPAGSCATRPPSTRSMVPVTVFMGGLPMKRATKRLAGLA